MKKLTGVLWGIALIAIGIIFGLNALGVTTIDLFFDGWWTLFIIIPCFIGLFTERDKVGNFMGIVVGAVLLLACQDIISFDLLWKLLVPALIVAIGLNVICKALFKKSSKNENSIPRSKGGKMQFVLFSGSDLDYSGQVFEGAKYTAIFGGIDVHLENAIIEHDVTIDATAVFGGIDLYLPDGVNVKVSSASVFGGVGNERKRQNTEGAFTVYVNGSGIFGGVDVN